MKVRRWVAMLLVAALTVNACPVSAPAETVDTAETATSSESVEIAVEGTNDVSNLIAQALEQTESTQSSEENYITDLTVSDTTATVLYWMEDASIQANLVVAIYDETTGQMLASGTAEVNSDDNIGTVELEGTVPDYFIVKAYLLDESTHQPLCSEFVSEMYTQEMQEFLSTTTADYDAERVVNLDEDDSTNFLVFNDDVILVENSSQNVVTDNGDGTYTVTNADSTFTGMKKGDTFSYQQADGTLLIVKVKSISVSGTTVTITEDGETELTDVFDYVKIDSDSSDAELTYDETDMDEGVTYLGEGDLETYASPSLDEADLDTYTSSSLMDDSASDEDLETCTSPSLMESTWGTYENETNAKKSLNYTLNVKLDSVENKSDTVSSGITMSLSGSLKIDYETSVKLYATLSRQYYSITLDYTLNGEIDLEIKSNLEVKLGTAILASAYGVIIKVKGVFCVEASAVFAGKLTMTGTIVKIYDSETDKSKARDESTKPQITYQMEFQGKLYFGLKLTLSAEFLNDNIASAEISAKLGVQIVMSTVLDYYDEYEEERHTCDTCYEGEAYFLLSASYSIKMLGGIVSISSKIPDSKELKLMDFYYSADYNEWGFRKTCPHKSYRITLKVVDQAGNPVEDAVVSGTGFDEDLVTDENGKVIFFLPDGLYYLYVSTGSLVAGRGLSVDGHAKDVKATLGKMYLEGEEENTSGILASGTCGTNITWELYNDGAMYIKGKGAMTTWKKESSVPWYSYVDSITSVAMGPEITSIGGYAFSDCENLAKVSIGVGVESIGACAFRDCTSLTTVVIPDSVTTIDQNAFQRCKSLAELTLSKNLESIGNTAFAVCSALESVELPEGVTVLDYYTFSNCTNLTNVTFGSNVTEIDNSAFAYCSSLTTIEIPDTVTTIGERAFYFCSALTDITLGNQVTSIGSNAFGECASLKTVTLPKSLVSVDSNAFNNCDNISNVYYNGTGADWIGISFADLKSNPCHTLAAFHVWGANGYTSLTSLEIPEGTTSIGPAALAGCQDLVTVTIPDSVTEIGENAFRSCYQLSSIVIPDGVTAIPNSAFRNCLKLASVTIPDSVTEIGSYAFLNCYQLTNVVIPDSVITMGDYTFAYCTSLQSIDLGDGLTRVPAYCCYGCTALASLTIGDSVTCLDMEAFRNCESLTRVVIPESVTKFLYGVFGNCTALEKVYLPASLTFIGDYAFGRCTALTDVYYGGSAEDWSNIQRGGSMTWYGCSSATVHYNCAIYSFASLGVEAPEGLSDEEVVIDDRAAEVAEETAVINSIFAEAADEDETAEEITGIATSDEITEHAASMKATSEETTSEDTTSEDTTEGTSAEDVSSAGPQTADYSGLLSGENYVLLVVADEKADDLLAASNLLYIGEEEADDSGNLTFTYYPRTAVEGMVLLLYGPSTRDIADAEITLGADTYCYTGGQIKPLVSVVYDGTMLEEDIDYTLSYQDNRDAGTASVIIKGYDQYSGTVTKTFTIVEYVSIWDCDVTLVEDSYVYTGAEIVPELVVTYDGTVLTEGIDYEVNYYNNTDAGKGKIWIGGIGTYLDSTTVSFVIDAKSIASADITFTETGCTYDGTKQEPAITVKDGTTTLVNNTDYTVSYSDNVAAGTATAWVEGAGNYTGTVKATFTISKASQKVTASAAKSSIKAGNTTTITASGKGTITYSSSDTSIATVSSKGVVTGQGVGKVTITVKAAGNSNYKSATKTVTITVGLTAPTISSVKQSGKTVTVKWAKIKGAKGYYVYRSTSKNGTYSKVKTITSGSTVSYSDTASKSNGTTYYYKVYAYSGSTKSAASSAKSIKYMKGSVASLTNTASGITVKWSKVSNATGYYVYRKASGASKYTLVTKVTNASTVSYTDKAVKSKNGTTYTYYVQPYNSSSKGYYATKKTVRLTSTSISSLKNSSSKKMTVKWSKNSKVTAYQIQYSTSSTFASGNKTVTVSKASTVSRTIGSLKKGKTYYVRIRSYKTVSGVKYYSAWSSKKSVKISK